MNLYEYELTSDGQGITKKTFEVEDKPKTYTFCDKWHYPARIRKEEIGQFGDYRNRIWLTEDNFEKAKSMFLNKLQSEITNCECKIKNWEKELQKLENKFAVLKRLSEVIEFEETEEMEL